MSPDINREYGSVYRYMSPPNMPGVRHLCGANEERYTVNDLNAPFSSFMTADGPSYGSGKSSCNAAYEASQNYPAYTLPADQPNWIPPSNLPIIQKRKAIGYEGFEGFSDGSNSDLFINLSVYIIILCLIIATGMYLLKRN